MHMVTTKIVMESDFQVAINAIFGQNLGRSYNNLIEDHWLKVLEISYFVIVKENKYVSRLIGKKRHVNIFQKRIILINFFYIIFIRNKKGSCKELHTRKRTRQNLLGLETVNLSNKALLINQNVLH